MRCRSTIQAASAVEQILEEPLFQRQRPFVGRQRLVLEGLQFGRDVALGILQRLAAAVVVRHLGRVGVADLDVEAMHLVVLDLEAGDAGAFALAGFQIEQELAAVGLQCRAVRRVRRDQPGAITPPSRSRVAGSGATRAAQQFEAVGGRCQVRGASRASKRRGRAGQRFGECRQLRQAVAQAGEVARPGVLQGDARGDAFDVRDAAQLAAYRPVGAIARVAEQFGDRRLPCGGHAAVGERMMQAVAQPARAHAGRAGVEQREQGGRGLRRAAFR